MKVNHHKHNFYNSNHNIVNMVFADVLKLNQVKNNKVLYDDNLKIKKPFLHILHLFL